MLASYSSPMFWLNWMFSGFKSEHVVTLVPAVADGRLVNLPIFALTFKASRCCFHFSFSLVFRHCGCGKPYHSRWSSRFKTSTLRTVIYFTVLSLRMKEALILPMC